MDTIFGYIERITFQNSETGYAVIQLQERGRKELTCVVGNMPHVKPGETIRCKGSWKQHLVHGRQFEVTECSVEAPADLVGIRKYLGSGLVKGIGPTYAGRIVQKFGVDTLTIIDEFPERLLEVEGLGKKRVDKIKSCWTDQKSIRDVMIFLQGHNISPTYAQKIFKSYGSQSIQQVKQNPYQLARDITGIGFKTADVIANRMGIDKENPQRIEAGIEFVLSQLADEGHVCYPLAEFYIAAEKVLEVGQNLVQTAVQSLKQQDRIVLFDLFHEGKQTNFIAGRYLFLAETGIARELIRLKNTPCNLRQIDTQKAVEWVQQKLTITLATNQVTAVTQTLSDKTHIITGGPGTGKSTITNAILTISAKLTDKILLAAPTGRAAKRMSEITGYKASTIHSLLEFDFKNGQFKRNRSNPLDCDLIIVDESSMIDTYLMFSLLKAIPGHARLILVGDINQLPSVGPGNVLKDIINSKCIPVTQLNEIFRQAAGSSIITNAHRINNGNFPDISNRKDSDFFFIDSEDPQEVLNQIVTLVSQRLPRKYGFDPAKDIQVLAPMKRGIIGTENLNAVLQQTLNPKENPLFWAGRKFSEGDKVMQIRNNYQREVYNGDIGWIAKVDLTEQQLVVTFDDRNVVYEFSDLDELMLSYAVSIHKFQGSQCPCVVIPIHTTHFILLTRNLFYTGVTRGKKLVVVVGNKKGVSIAVRNDDVKKRYTGLQQALVAYQAGGLPV